jgi:molecular chaperone GrpE
VLADFQRWYEQAVAGALAPGNGELPPLPPDTVDLATLLGHFVALRQEVNLQTRSVRAGQEQTADFFRRLEEDIDALARARGKPAVDEKEIVRPLLKTLIDLYDALSLAGQQIQRVRSVMLPLLDGLASLEPEGELMAAAPGPAGQRSFWSRWFLSPSADAALQASQEQTQQALAQLHEERRLRQERGRQAREGVERIRQALEGLVTGYTMSLERIDRALAQHGLEPMPAVGEMFDPELMEAVDTAIGTGRPGEVVEEVRRGYLQAGRVFRCAQVRVARS